MSAFRRELIGAERIVHRDLRVHAGFALDLNFGVAAGNVARGYPRIVRAVPSRRIRPARAGDLLARSARSIVVRSLDGHITAIADEHEAVVMPRLRAIDFDRSYGTAIWQRCVEPTEFSWAGDGAMADPAVRTETRAAINIERSTKISSFRAASPHDLRRPVAGWCENDCSRPLAIRPADRI